LRLLVHVEGQTKESFVNDVLAPHLYNIGFTKVWARLLGNSRLRERRGGNRSWAAVRGEIIAKLHEDKDSIATTMVDYYALPSSGSKAWPGRSEAASLPYDERASFVEASLLQDLVGMIGDGFNPRRFVPYVMMHEFEGMLFSSCHAFANAIG